MESVVKEDFRNIILPNSSKEKVESLNNSINKISLIEEGSGYSELPIRRLSLKFLSLDSNWKNFFKENSHSTSSRWQEGVEHRRKKVAIISILLSSFVTLIIYKNSSYSIYIFLNYIYLIIQFILVYILSSMFLKIIFGMLYSFNGYKKDSYHPLHRMCSPQKGIKVAIVYPVYHEDMIMVSARIGAMLDSIREDIPNYSEIYDIYLLSDSRDLGVRISEKIALYHLRKNYPDFSLFYRCRITNENAKLGNISDFLRRWGSYYKYIFMMDADSLVTGEAIHSTLCIMEGNPRIGIVQTNPLPILRNSFFGRMLQFNTYLVGSVFSHALQSMYMGHSAYIGHNALLRTEAFIKHCILPPLAGKKPWGGRPLSHDILEAIFMVRGGYEVWYLPEIKGSYEETPPDFISFIQREKRWMYGNLQHLRFLCVDNIVRVHRELLLNGILGYLSAPIWGVSILISSSLLLYNTYSHYDYFSLGGKTSWVFLGGIGVFLFVPRVLALLFHMNDAHSRQFGGRLPMFVSFFWELVFFIFLSPVIMVCLSYFLCCWILKKDISWGAQKRQDSFISIRRSLKFTRWVLSIGFLFLFLFLYVPYRSELFLNEYLTYIYLMKVIWMAPILLGLISSPFLVCCSSRVYDFLYQKRIFFSPVETKVPRIVRNMKRLERDFSQKVPSLDNFEEILRYAVSDPFFYANHHSTLREKERVYQLLKERIQLRKPLSSSEMWQSLNEKRCFELLYKIYGKVSV